MAFLKLIRFPNLLIIILTQYLLEYLVLLPALNRGNLTPILDDFHFFLLVISTVLIAAGGFIINDLKDYEIDILNKPNKVIIHRKISISTAKKSYWGITIFGFIISLYLAFFVKNLPLILIYPIAVLLLFLYSNSLKKSALWGNLIVSLFCAFVAGVVIFAERENVIQLSSQQLEYGNEVVMIFGFYLTFAFLSTLFREIIKDIEDMDGDQKNGGKTLPIFAGKKVAKWVAIAVGLILLFFIYQWKCRLGNQSNWSENIYLIFGIVIPLVMTILLILNAKTKKDFHSISQISKYIMLSGLIYLIILSWK